MQIPESLAHIFRRTLPLKTSGTSSSFVMSFRGQQWLVTADHVVRSPSGQDRNFEAIQPNGLPWAGLERLTQTSHADVAVFRLGSTDFDTGPQLVPYETGADAVRALQPVYLLGFPHLGDAKLYSLTQLSPMVPLIRQAIVSGEADDKGINVWLLDGMANHGMSGGPAIIRCQESDEYRVFGVISSYVPANAPNTPARPQSARPPAVGVPPPSSIGSYFQTNSGLAIVYDIRHVVDVINKAIDGESIE